MTPTEPARPSLLSRLGPGLLVAATGVGAGDLATASFTGSQLGTAVLWAVALGAGLKFALNEGLARWQLATGQTFLEGVLLRGGRWLGWVFLPYLLLWSFFVGSALVSACGVTLHAMLPFISDPTTARWVYGVGSSLAGLWLVWRGGFPWFERAMNACVALMFVSGLVCAGASWPGTVEVLKGLLIPTIPQADGSGVEWTAALIGGVGGTLTILCHGYWIREKGLTRLESLPDTRLDLAVGYAVTAFFGASMVIIGSNVEVSGSGANLLVALSAHLGAALGPIFAWAFLLGAFGAVFSSVLGVWQAVPYLFADLWRLTVGPSPTDPETTLPPIDTRALPYRAYLVGISIVPLLGLFANFKEIQKLYALIGAALVPALAAGLLYMNGRRAWVGEAHNRWPSRIALTVAVLFFAVLAFYGGAS